MDRDTTVKHWRRVMYGALFPGDRYKCPFCEKSFGRFLSGGSRVDELKGLGAIGIGRRKNARCPSCGSNDRARLMTLFLRSNSSLSNLPTRVLHIAPDRHVSKTIRSNPQVEYTCGSLYPEDYADLEACRIDVANIPFADNSFDIVLCNHVLQQVPDDLCAMRELARVLKPSGFGVIQSPIAQNLAITREDASIVDPKARRRTFGSTLHLRIYGRDYAQRLTDQGFQVTVSHPVRDGWCPDSARYAVIQEEELYVVKKSTVAKN